MITRIFVFLALLITNYFLLIPSVHAICPVCTIAVGAGVGLSRYLGIDDTVTGVWVGGLTVSMIVWSINWLISKKKTFRFYKLIIILAYYLLIVVPLTYSDIIGHPLNRLFGIDKLLLGIIFGSGIFIAGNETYKKVKEKNNGKAHFPFEKVAFPVASLVLMSIIFYIITK